jgi:hypothetical protein
MNYNTTVRLLAEKFLYRWYCLARLSLILLIYICLFLRCNPKYNTLLLITTLREWQCLFWSYVYIFCSLLAIVYLVSGVIWFVARAWNRRSKILKIIAICTFVLTYTIIPLGFFILLSQYGLFQRPESFLSQFFISKMIFFSSIGILVSICFSIHLIFKIVMESCGLKNYNIIDSILKSENFH